MQHYTQCELHFLAARSATFISKKHYRHTSQTNSQTASFAQVTSSTKIYEKINPEIELITDDQTSEIQKNYDLLKQTGELI